MKRSLQMLIVCGLTSMIIAGCNQKPAVVEDKSNPFFSDFNTSFNVPPFEKIMAKHYKPAFLKGMADGREEIKNITNNKEKPTFQNTIEALDKSGMLLTKVSSVFFSQASANTNDSIQQLQVEISPLLSTYYDEILLNSALFSKIKAVFDNRANLSLNPEQSFLLENLYKNFVRNGALLKGADQDSLKKFNENLAVLTVKFSQNILGENKKFRLVIDKKDDLKGLPAGVIDGAASQAKNDGMEGKWVFTIQKPSMLPFLTYDDNRDLRRTLYNGYTTKCNHGDNLDNNKILADMISLRAKKAKLLGFKTFADLALDNRMAKTPANVYSLLNQLWTPALKVAGEELKEMQKIADHEGAKFKIEPSDWWYYAEKLRKQKYDLDDNELRPYFQLDNVREGAFAVANKLYGITFTQLTNIPLPHPDAKAFEVKEADGSHVGILYMDFYTRSNKEQGAWCGSYRDHKWLDGKEIKPVVTIVCNFNNPSGEIP